MDRISPRILCNLSTPTLCWVRGMAWTISFSRATTQEHANLTRDPYLRQPNAKLLAYVDFFVDNFLGLAQGPRHHRRHVRRTLFHALDKVF